MYSPVEVVVAVVAAGCKWTALLTYTLHWPNAHNNNWHFLVHSALLWSTLLKTWNLSVSVCLCFCLSVCLSLSLSLCFCVNTHIIKNSFSTFIPAKSWRKHVCCWYKMLWMVAGSPDKMWMIAGPPDKTLWMVAGAPYKMLWMVAGSPDKMLWMVAGSQDKMWMVAGPPDKMLWMTAGSPDKILWMVAGSPECACWASGCWPLTVSRWTAPSCARRTPRGPSTSTTVNLSTPPRGSTNVTSILRVTRRSSWRLSLVLAAASSSVSLCVLFCRLSEQTGDACQGLSDIHSLECWSWVVLCFSDWSLARLLGLRVSFLLLLLA